MPQAFVEENGLVVIEMESAENLPGSWRDADSSNAQVSRNIDNPGAAAGDDYIVWEGSQDLGNPGRGTITYKVKIDTPGVYVFDWHNQVGLGTNTTEHNDTWLKIHGDAFYGVKGNEVVHPKGAGPENDYPDGARQPQGGGKDGWFKVYSSGASDWKWSARTSDHEGFGIRVRFDEPGIYDIDISARSSSHVIDRMVLFHEDQYDGNARDLSLPESQRIDVADTPPADDPPPPADEPTPPADDPTPPDQPEPTGSVDLYLIDATTDQRVGSGPLEDGDTLSASLLSAGMFSIEADPDGAAGSVRLTWSEGGTQTEGVEPYALFGDSGGDFAGRAAQSGTQSVTVQVYAGGNANGELLAQKTVSFSFDGVSPPPQDDPGGTPAPAIDPQGLAMQADHIVFHFDGNNNDRDDIAAIPIAALLAEAGGVADKMTFLYGNNLSEPNQNSRMSELDAGGDFAKGFGIEALNYQDDVAATTARLIALLETGDEILLIEGGPMEAIYRAMEAVDPSLHANLTLLSHSTWNEDRDVTSLPGVTEARTWSDLKSDFPTATYVDIRDQNDGHNNTRGFNNSGWEWMDDSDAPLIQRARDIMEPADYAFNDPSDAGMLFYALTGVDNATPTEARALFEASGILDMPMIHLGTEGADSLTGQSEAEIFYGLQEADTIDGAGGNDYAEGGSGSDEIFGRAGDDTLRGGAAGDMVDGGGGKDRLNGGQGYDTLIGGLGNDTLRGEKGKDTLEGGDGRDVLYGGRKADLLMGGNHRDTLRGQQGDDTLEGGQYGDWLYGDQGKDILRGGSGRDQLDGGTWRDELTGGAGEDKFIFRAGYGHDTITDFEDDTDTVLLGVNLGAGLTDMTGAQIIETYAVSAGGGAPLVLDFGDDSLTFNLTYGQRSQLADDIELI